MSRRSITEKQQQRGTRARPRPDRDEQKGKRPLFEPRPAEALIKAESRAGEGEYLGGANKSATSEQLQYIPYNAAYAMQ